MFEKYIATKEDLLAIEEGISYIYKPELNFIFKDKTKIDHANVISFDSKNIFIWRKAKSIWKLETYPHKSEITDQMQKGWQCGLIRIKALNEYLPQYLKRDDWYNTFAITGGLINPLINLQKSLERPLNPYTTPESYLATIIHEFGHIYFNNIHKYSYYDKDENINYMQAALQIYQGDSIDLSKCKIRIPEYKSLSEVFAFCTDYSASKIFFKNHYDDITKSNTRRITKNIKIEESLNYYSDTSTLDESHVYASIFGAILVKKYKNNWVDKLLECRYL